MTLQPAQLELVEPESLRVVWNDGSSTQYTIDSLRKACPCASCREQRNEPETPVSAMELPVVQAGPERLGIRKMHPVGTYAYNIEFSDGHDTGIFTFEYLLGLAGR